MIFRTLKKIKRYGQLVHASKLELMNYIVFLQEYEDELYRMIRDRDSEIFNLKWNLKVKE